MPGWEHWPIKVSHASAPPPPYSPSLPARLCLRTSVSKTGEACKDPVGGQSMKQALQAKPNLVLPKQGVLITLYVGAYNIQLRPLLK